MRYEKDGKTVDSKCRDMTSSFVREAAATNRDIELCEFYEARSLLTLYSGFLLLLLLFSSSFCAFLFRLFVFPFENVRIVFQL